MTDEQKQEIHNQRLAETIQNQRNNALNDVVNACGRIAVLEAEIAELKQENSNLIQKYMPDPPVIT